MKRFFSLVLITLIGFQGFSQSDKQVKWSFQSKKIAENTFEVSLVAQMNGNWHIYSQNGGDGPVSTSFSFSKSPLVLLEGKVKENGKMKKVFEEAFGSEVRFYEKNVQFIQVVKIKGKAKTNLSGKIEFMVCNDKECLPPATVEFKIPVGG